MRPTHAGLSLPPATAFSGSELRPYWLGPPLFAASCVVGVGNKVSASRYATSWSVSPG